MPHSKVPRDHAAAGALPRLSMKRAAGLGVAIALTSLIGLPAAAAPQETVLYSFSGGADGSHPEAGLVMDGNGALYETTWGAGGGTDGTVFMLAPPGPGRTGWSKTTLHRFTGGDDGSRPFAGLIMDASGALYGTTSGGGVFSRGTVFKLTPPASGETHWTARVLHAFRGGAVGAKPSAGLIMDASGALYSTTPFGGGGSCGICGTVFKLTPPAAGETRWTQTVLHSFTGGADGDAPFAGLIMDASGALYGTTYAGGPGCVGAICGTVFKLTPPAAGETRWTETVLHSFTNPVTGGADGASPGAGVIMGASGALYGTTVHGGGGCRSNFGCGTVFKVVP